MDSSETQESGASATADTQALQEQQAEEKDQNQTVSSEPQESNQPEPELPAAAEIPPMLQGHTEETEKQQEQAPTENAPNQVRNLSATNLFQTKQVSTDKQQKEAEDAAVDNEVENAAKNSGLSVGSEQLPEVNQPELKVSDSETLIEAGQDETKDEAPDKASTSEAQSG